MEALQQQIISLKIENASLKLFKEQAEENCEAFAITETLTTRIQELEKKCSVAEDMKKVAQERCKVINEQNKFLVDYLVDDNMRDMCFGQFIEWINKVGADNKGINVYDILEDKNIEVYTDPTDDFSEYWDQYKEEFQVDGGDEDNIDDYDCNSDEFIDWYIENHLQPTEYCYDCDGALYCYE